MRTLIGAIIAVVAGLAIAGGGTYALIATTSPDKSVPFNDRPLPNNTNGVVSYGSS